MFSAHGSAVGKSSIAFVSKASLETVRAGYDLQKNVSAVETCRGIGKADLHLNSLLPAIDVNPETYKVTADGVHLTCEPAEKLPLAQLYNLF